jgi:hypothetical protein
MFGNITVKTLYTTSISKFLKNQKKKNNEKFITIDKVFE